MLGYFTCSTLYKYHEVIIKLWMHSNVNLGKTLRVVEDRGVLRPYWFFLLLKESDQLKALSDSVSWGTFRGHFENVRANSAVALFNCFKDSQPSFIWESKSPNQFTVWYSTTWVNQAADIYLLSPYFISKNRWNLNQIAKLTITRTWVVNVTEFLHGRFKRYITLAVFHVHQVSTMVRLHAFHSSFLKSTTAFCWALSKLIWHYVKNGTLLWNALQSPFAWRLIYKFCSEITATKITFSPFICRLWSGVHGADAVML